MNRTDRLFAITTRLLGRRVIRAEELAHTFEVSRRTIYRDIAALSQSGVPVVSLPGQGYSVADGYALPPLNLTSDEALALLVGARLLRAEASGALRTAATSSVDKIIAILGDESRRSLQDLDRAVEFGWDSPGPPPLDLTDTRIGLLRTAIAERRPVLIRYTSKEHGRSTTRTVEPSRLSYVNGVWYLTAYCRLREDERAFRCDRIDEAHLLAERFSPRPPSGPSPAPDRIEVCVRFREPAARWVRERQHWTFQHEESSPDGITFTYAVPTLDDVVPWLLGWGILAEIVSPAALRERVRSEASAIVEMLT